MDGSGFRIAAARGGAEIGLGAGNPILHLGGSDTPIAQAVNFCASQHATG
jgi:hypothetical protein